MKIDIQACSSDEDLRHSQSLRYDIYVEEMGRSQKWADSRQQVTPDKVADDNYDERHQS